MQDNQDEVTPQAQEPTTQEPVRDAEAVLAKNRELLETIHKQKEQLSAMQTAEEKRRQKEMEERGEYEKLNAELTKQLDELKPYRERYTQAVEAETAALKDLAEGSDAELAELIISHPDLTFDKKVKRIKALTTDKKQGSPKTEGASTQVATVTPEVFAKMSTLEKAKLPPETLKKLRGN